MQVVIFVQRFVQRFVRVGDGEAQGSMKETLGFGFGVAGSVGGDVDVVEVVEVVGVSAGDVGAGDCVVGDVEALFSGVGVRDFEVLLDLNLSMKDLRDDLLGSLPLTF